MLASFLTAALFAMSAVCGRRAADRFGALQANAIRLLIAVACLGLVTWLFNADGFAARTSTWLVISGVIGFGLGDIALYLALPRLGSRLTLLLNFCTAPMFAAAGDFLLLGETIRPLEAVAGAVVLSGVALALMPEAMHRDNAGRLVNPLFTAGVVWGILAGLGQGLGASLSRYAHGFAGEEQVRLTGMGEAFQRASGGVVIALLAWVAVHWWRHRRAATRTCPGGSTSRNGCPGDRSDRPVPTGRPIPWRPARRAWWWLIGAAMFGPVIGVSCFQWALHSAPSAVVLIIVATSPLLVIPLARWLERDRPRPIALLGSLIAVAGLALLLTVRAG